MNGFYEGCFFCALAKETPRPEKCFECACPEVVRQSWIYSFGLYFARYQRQHTTSQWSQAIVLAKRCCFPLIGAFGRMLSFYFTSRLPDLRPCLITSVPSFSADFGLFRGYTSFTTRLLLDAVAGAVEDDDWMIAHDLLVQSREKPVKQHRCRSDGERKKNIHGIYTLPDARMVSGRNIILLDDVVTSGATLAECRRVLHQAGARSVTALTLARTARKKENHTLDKQEVNVM